MSIHKVQKHFYLSPVSIACLVMAAISTVNISAAPITLSQQPAGNGGREPAPNVILSVDNSGSMGWDINGCQTIDWNVGVYGNRHESGSVGCGAVGTISLQKSRIQNLREALIAQFGNGTANSGLLADNRIRLAWQSMWLNGGPAGSDTLTVGATNTMKRFSGAHRVNFNTFVNSLTSVNGTPSHKMLAQAYSLMTAPASMNSPWASNPGVAELPYLACRRTYNIFMTDGAWNSETATTQTVGNADGTARTLPSPDASLALNSTPPAAYNPTSAQTRIYKDNFGGAKGSLSDFAFRNWAEDLQPSMKNEVRPLIKQSGTETVGATSLQEFWNPKNDPATWQHITQHTIGFGRSATTWSGAPLWDNVTDNHFGGDYSSLVNGTVTWQDTMPAAAENTPAPGIRQSELWHAAINGRGKFYPARTSAALSAAFSDILNNILSDTSKPLVSIAANGTRMVSGLKAYVAGYDGEKWSGRLLAYPINATTGTIGTTAAWSATGTGTLDVNGKLVVNDPGKLDDPSYSVSNRFVMSANTNLVAPSSIAGFEWKTYSSLPLTHQIPMNLNSNNIVDGNGQRRVDYIRGDRTKEASKVNGIFRDRNSRLGDIVNSNVLYVGKPNSGYSTADYTAFKGTTGSGVGGRAPMVYVGANDGMLHGFDAATGLEKIAYIPQGIATGDLRKLTDTTYSHQYYVDSTPFISDAKVGTSAVAAAWKTVLVSGLGGGGKGYFALDASNPSNFNALNASNLVLADTTFSNTVTTLATAAGVPVNSAATYDPDIGNMYITPAMDDFIAGKSDQIVRLNAPTTGTAPNQTKHRWALVLGNGYNSANEAPVLIVQYLDGAREIKKISPCIAALTGVFDTTCAFKTGNGLSTPRLVDLNGDSIADVAYAGDLNGNVWKFDLSSTNNANWKTSFNSAPFFKAKSGQAFTTAPYVASNDAAGFGVVVNINSGRNLTTADQSSTNQETVYTLWDNSTFKDVPVTPPTYPATYKLQITDSTPINTTNTIPSTLVQQTISATTFVDKGFTYFTSSSNPVNYKAATPKRGWYMDWAGVAGQRVLQNSKSFDGQKIQINSTKPSSVVASNSDETCTPATSAERSFLTVLNLFNGNPSQSPVFDLTPTVATTNPNTTMIEGNPAGDSIGIRTDNGIKFIPPCPEGTTCSPPPELKFGKYVGARANWREKQ
jgi:type IV pilus assembly protein PilY1